MQVTFLGQGVVAGLDRAVGDELRAATSDAKFTAFEAFVAFVSSPAAKFLCDLISKRPGFSAYLYVGVDQKATSKEALETLLGGPVNTKIFFTTSNPIYHPKIYIFVGPSDARIILGSSNLTITGLFTNVESSVRVDFTRGDVGGEALLKQIHDFFMPITSAATNVQVLSQTVIDALHVHGLVPTETSRAVNQGEFKSTASGHSPRVIHALFPPRPSAPMPISRGKKKAVAKADRGKSAPKSTAPNATVPSAPSPSGRDFWIETGTLTGGSRNQLDLSMVSARGQINGSLSLFGLERSNAGTVKTVRLRYKGKDYDDNHILFPQTSIGKTNGTWRLQMNGVDSSGNPLTTHCKKDFLKKILIFSEIGSDHYEIKPVSTLRNLGPLKDASTSWDQNRGKHGRHFGVL